MQALNLVSAVKFGATILVGMSAGVVAGASVSGASSTLQRGVSAIQIVPKGEMDPNQQVSLTVELVACAASFVSVRPHVVALPGELSEVPQVLVYLIATQGQSCADSSLGTHYFYIPLDDEIRRVGVDPVNALVFVQVK